jgi:hypothetical protein
LAQSAIAKPRLKPIAAGQQVHSIALVHAARAAFADGLGAAVLVSAGVA